MKYYSDKGFYESRTNLQRIKHLFTFSLQLKNMSFSSIQGLLDRSRRRPINLPHDIGTI